MAQGALHHDYLNTSLLCMCFHRQGRLEAEVHEALRRHISTWDVRDVCNWVDVVGFPQ